MTDEQPGCEVTDVRRLLATRLKAQTVILWTVGAAHDARVQLLRSLGSAVVALCLAGTFGVAVSTPAVAAPAPMGQCSEAHLKVRVHYDGMGAGAGQRLAEILFQNTGPATCELRGAPGVSLVGHGNGTQLGRPADREQPRTPATLRLRPGQSAQAYLQFIAVDQHGGAYGTTCKPMRADGYRVYPPHSSRAVYVPSAQYACASTKIHWGDVTVVKAPLVGCATTRSGIPKAATTRKITDVDGDYRADTEWITTTRFGITTASGATSSVKPAVPGGGNPGALSFVLQNTSTALTVIAGSRDAQLFRFNVPTCSLKPVLNKQGHQYRFDLTGAYGSGVACTDPDGNGVDQITGTRLSRPLGSLTDGDTDTVSSTVISIHGLHASNGATRTHTYTWPADKKQLDAAATITCHGASINRTGITAHHA